MRRPSVETEKDLDRLRERIAELELERDSAATAGIAPGRLFEAFVENDEDLKLVLDRERRIRWASQAAERLLGLSPESCVGRGLHELLHPDDRERWREALERWRPAVQTPLRHENRLVAESGEIEDALWVLRPDLGEGGEVTGYFATARVVTRRKNAERVLRREQTWLAAVLASVLDPTLVIDGRGTILSASDSVLKVFGYGPEELLSENVRILMPEPHHSQHDEYLARYHRTGTTNILGRTREFDVIHKDGSVLTCELSVSRVDVPGGEPCFVGSFRDITDRHQAQRRLAESAERFRAVFDQELQYVGLLSTDGLVIDMNRAALQAIDAELGDVAGKPFWDTAWWPRTARWTERVRRAVADAAGGHTVRFDVSVMGPGGRVRTIDFSLKPVRSESGEIRMLLPEGRDITELQKVRRDQEQIQRSLARIGESAAVLAHEIKSPLAAVNVALRAVARQLGEDEQTVLTELTHRMQRLEQMVRSTLSLTRPLDIASKVCRASELLTDAAREVELEAGEKQVAVTIDVPEDDLTFVASQELVDEVLTNLARNAVEALPTGGRVVLGARLRDDKEITFFVQDDGPGVPGSIRETLFNPFVTSKATGTGLGLAICRKIAEAHGGRIELADCERGARFEVHLPTGIEDNE